MNPTQIDPPYRVATIGGGFGELARPPRDADVEITRIDRTNHRRYNERALVVSLGALVAALLYAPAGTAQAVELEKGGAITLTVENDVLTGSDDNYTNGLGITWVSDDLDSYDDKSPVRRWGRFWSFLPFIGDDGYTTYASWTLAQEMHTPSDITLADPPLADQPYAGVLYVDSVLYARSKRWTHAWSLKLGTTGDASQAGATQREFHKLIGADKPMGWDTQVPEEPVINFGYTAAHLWKEGNAGSTAKWRLVPIGSVSLGTYFTGVGFGMYGEVGWNLSDALGGTSLRDGLNAASTVGVEPSKQWSLSFFGGLGGHAVYHYLPLDGTVFRGSRSVDSRPFIGNATVGASLRRGRFALSLSVNQTTKAFDNQKKGAEFANLSFSWIR